MWVWISGDEEPRTSTAVHHCLIELFDNVELTAPLRALSSWCDNGPCSCMDCTVPGIRRQWGKGWRGQGSRQGSMLLPPQPQRDGRAAWGVKKLDAKWLTLGAELSRFACGRSGAAM